MEKDQLLRALSTHALFRCLDTPFLEQLLAASSLLHFRARRAVVREGQPARHAYVLLRGAVRVFHRSLQGSEVLVKLFRAPGFFGEMETLTGEPFQEHAATLEPSTLLAIPSDALAVLVDRQPAFAAALVRDLSSRLCIATRNERALAFGDVTSRLASVLLDHATLAGERIHSGVRITTRMSQDTLAKDLGVSRKSVFRALEGLRKKKLIAKDRGRFVLMDVEQLRALSSHGAGLAYWLT